MNQRRRPLLVIAVAVCVSVAVWCSLGTLTLTSAWPGGQRIGILPPLWVFGAVFGAVLGALWMARPSRDRLLPGFLSGALILPWLPLPWPAAVLAMSGPVTWLVWGGVAAAVWAAEDRPERSPAGARGRLALRSGPVTASVLAFAIYAIASWQTAPVLPGGDEPHYLVITQSLLIDGDLRIENNHRRGDYEAYFRGALRPDYLRRGQDGEIYSIHLPGLSVVVAPAFALGGYQAVRLWLAALAALAVGAAWRMTYQVTDSRSAAWFATAATAFTVPYLFLAFTVYPDGIAGAAIVWAFAMLVTTRDLAARSPYWWAAAGLPAAALPWLHPRFALLSASLGAVFVARALGTTRALPKIGAYLLVPLLSAAGWFGYYQAVYGSPNPSMAYGHYTQMSAWNALRGLPGLLFDGQFGLVATAPVFAFAMLGLIPLVRYHRRLGVEWLAVVVPYALVTSMYHMWWGGQSSPARFLGPAMLLCALPIAASWRYGRGSATRALHLTALAVSLVLGAIFLFTNHGRFGFSFRDGFAQWAVWASTLADVARALPSWFRPAGGAAAGTTAWIASVTLAWALSRWLIQRWSLAAGAGALASGACLLAAAVAAAGINWRSADATGIAPTRGQLTVVRALASARMPLTVSYDPLRVGVGRAVAGGLRLSGDGTAGAPADAWLWLPDLPGGRYQLWADIRRPGAAFDIELTIGRSGVPFLIWPLRDALPGPQSFDVTLPVDVHSLGVTGPREQRDALDGLWLQPVISPGPIRASGARATAARRYGNTLAWALGDGVYLEGDGLWVAGAIDAELVLDGPVGGGIRRLGVRGGAVATTAVLTSGRWQVTLTLNPGERQEVPVPVAGGDPMPVRIRTDTGFRPSSVDASSRDDRFLGVWIDFPAS